MKKFYITATIILHSFFIMSTAQKEILKDQTYTNPEFDEAMQYFGNQITQEELSSSLLPEDFETIRLTQTTLSALQKKEKQIYESIKKDPNAINLIDNNFQFNSEWGTPEEKSLIKKIMHEGNISKYENIIERKMLELLNNLGNQYDDDIKHEYDNDDDNINNEDVIKNLQNTHTPENQSLLDTITHPYLALPLVAAALAYAYYKFIHVPSKKENQTEEKAEQQLENSYAYENMIRS